MKITPLFLVCALTMPMASQSKPPKRSVSQKYHLLRQAIAYGNQTKVCQLLDAGLDVNFPNPHDRKSALAVAARNGRISMVRLLLRRGATPTEAAEKAASKPEIRALLAQAVHSQGQSTPLQPNPVPTDSAHMAQRLRELETRIGELEADVYEDQSGDDDFDDEDEDAEEEAGRA